MELKEVVKTAILRNSHEWGDEQAEAVLKAINEAGFLIVPAKAVPDNSLSRLKNTLTAQYDRLNDVIHQEGYSDKIFGQLMALDFVEEVIDEMIKAQDSSHGI